MNCSNPFISMGLAFGCGQCMPCRFNRRRIWATRIMVEAAQYKDNAFVTCTYEDDSVASLSVADMQGFIKRLRARFNYANHAIGGAKFRFFGVGEYGDKSERPHYHYALFNFPSCRFGRSTYSRRRVDCCGACDMVRDAWGRGFVYLGNVENKSAGYISGYVTKKMTRTDDPRLGNRHPEFARMSLRPGIGADAMFDVAHTLLNFQNTLDTMADVPGELQVGRSKLPIGRYLKKKLRSYVGRDEKTPQAIVDEVSAEMLSVRMAARADKENPSFKAHLVAMTEGARASAAAKRQIFSKGRPV